MRVALVSEHASPLVAINGINAAGQHVHVAELASGLVASDIRLLSMPGVTIQT